MRGTWIVAALAVSACAETNTVRCGDLTCPPGSHCGPTNECVPADCGDGIVTGFEECDGDIDPESLRCTDEGFYKGPPLTCSATCKVDTSMCEETCGDHVINGPETCDGIPATGFSCSDYGFDIGTLGCSSGCAPAFEFCSTIGWQTLPGGAQEELYALHVVTPSSGVAVGHAGTIIAAIDGVWTPQISPTTQSLRGVAAAVGSLIAVGDGGTIIRYDGTGWSLMASPTTSNLNAVAGSPAGAIAVGDGGTILRYDGTSWATMTTPSTAPALYGVYVVNAVSAFAVGSDNTLWRMVGTTWTALPLSVPASPQILRAIYIANGELFISGDNATAVHVVGGIATQLNMPAGITNAIALDSTWGANATDVYFGGASGVIVHWNGSYLTEQDTPTNRSILGLDGIAEVGRVYGVTRGGEVIAYNGTNRRIEYPTNVDAIGVFHDGVNTVVVGDSARRLVNGVWTLQNVPVRLTSVWATGTDVYAGNEDSTNGGVYKSAAGGTFTKISSAGVNGIWGTSSPLHIVSVGDTIQESSNGTAFTPSTTPAQTLRAVWGTPDGTFFAVGNGGYAMRRLPGASSWQELPTPPVTNDLLAVWGTAADDVFVVGTLGTVLHWNGTAWHSMYSGTGQNLLSVSGTAHGDVYAVGTGYVRFHYDGVNWSRLAGNNLDINAVAAHGGDTYFVGYGGAIERFERSLATKEDRCTDAWDNDGGDGTNCDDPDCRDDAQCRRGGACETLERVTCETQGLETSTFSGVARLDDVPCLDHVTPGPEASFRYIAETSGSVTVTVDDPTGKLDLIVSDATFGHCDLATCRSAARSGSTLSVTFDTHAAEMYFIVVDGPVFTAEPFTLSVTCPAS